MNPENKMSGDMVNLLPLRAEIDRLWRPSSEDADKAVRIVLDSNSKFLSEIERDEKEIRNDMIQRVRIYKEEGKQTSTEFLALDFVYVAIIVDCFRKTESINAIYVNRKSKGLTDYSDLAYVFDVAAGANHVAGNLGVCLLSRDDQTGEGLMAESIRYAEKSWREIGQPISFAKSAESYMRLERYRRLFEEDPSGFILVDKLLEGLKENLPFPFGIPQFVNAGAELAANTYKLAHGIAKGIK